MKLKNLIPWKSTRVKPSTLLQAYGMGPFFNTSKAGVNVTEREAWGLASVYACVRVLSEAMATTPLHAILKRPDGSRNRLSHHRVERFFNAEPNPDMTGFQFKETLMGHLCLRGNAYAWIKRDPATAEPVELWPLQPDSIEVLRDPDLGIIYEYRPPQGSTLYKFPARDMLHFKGLSPNGLIGYSPLTMARETLGQGLAANEYASRFYANDSTPQGVLEKKEGMLTDEAYNRLRRDWEAKVTGDNRHRVAILEDGLAWKSIGVAPDDAQFLETRKLNRSEIASIFRVPSHLIQDLDRATFSNISEQDIGFVKHTMLPWFSRFEQAITQKLLMDSEMGRVYVEHQTASLLRGDIKTRFEAYAVLWDRGVISADEIREKENMNPQPNGQGGTFWIPVNYQPADLAATPDSGEGSADDPPQLPQLVPNAAAAHDTASTRSPLLNPETRARKAIQNSYRTILADSMARVIRREIYKIRTGVKTHLIQRSESSFKEWLEDFYRDISYMRNQVTPTLEGMAEAIGTAAAAEVGAEFADSPEFQEWLQDYIRNFSLAHANQSRGQLIGVLDNADPEAMGDAILARLEEWETEPTRAQKIAEHRTVDFGQSVAKVAFIGAGVMFLRWNASGDACPFCTEMDGKVVGVDEPFLPADTPLDPEGAETPIVHSRDVLQPPIHGGCNCTIEPGG